MKVILSKLSQELGLVVGGFQISFGENGKATPSDLKIIAKISEPDQASVGK